MDNKQNQPNSGSTSSSSAASNPPASAASANGAGTGFPATAASSGQPATPAPKAARKAPQDATSKAASTAESSQPQALPRKSWLNQEELLKGVNQLPQSLKELGAKAVEQVNGLSSTQKIVGGALLVSGLSWLALRSKKTKSSASGFYAPHNAKDETKWKSSTESVYRGASSSLHGSAADYGTENGF
ncbi:MAG: hypothetical protein H7Z21_02930 [Hymenobacter sp.]|nr:hypothetical protein [Hymenobacter sp.]